MKYINKKQKIVLIIIISIITLGICYYSYRKKENEKISISQQNLEIENKTEETNNVDTNNGKKEKIVIHVSGAVNKEGIVELDKNSRIADAIEAAGGIKENACMKDINLACILEDGVKIYIPTIEEVEKESQKENIEYIISGNGGNNSSGDSNDDDKVSSNDNSINKKKKININTATKEELDTLPGVGESTANKIINYRKENGKFESIEEIKEVNGIGDSKYEQIKNLIEI